ncbi:hypothetical protein NMQ03_16300 [Arthrobacter sp. DNA4]|uniref:hypothetical protein n=1 Tax=Arthrobacter sp. DNA4 TaxID=2963432 RepID=UPI0020CBDFC1|nr:hypothetical protein [Arthrobacter sp. DNA4]UTT68769.1 hypothetical protein NMQ03_16300 [Arthrobacter sp. DNA4]
MSSSRIIRFLLCLLLAFGTALGVSGCYNSGVQNYKSVAPGANLDLAGLELRSISVVAAAKEQPGRLLGMIFNPTSEDIRLVIRDRDNRMDLIVPANGQIGFDTSEHILQSTENPPGARTDLTLQAKGKSEVMDVPVLDGTLSQYAPYVPK